MTDSELMQLSEQVGQALKARGATVTTAESCTGGWVAKVITDIAGSSAWFERGFVTYSNEAKAQMIGVKRLVLITPCLLVVSPGRMAAVKRSLSAPSGLLLPPPVVKALPGGNASAVTVMRCVVRLLRMHCRPCGNNFYKTLDTV